VGLCGCEWWTEVRRKYVEGRKDRMSSKEGRKEGRQDIDGLRISKEGRKDKEGRKEGRM